jgi:hypothetical protein
MSTTLISPAPFQGAQGSFSHVTQGGARGLACPGLVYFGAFGAALAGSCTRQTLRASLLVYLRAVGARL